MKRQVGHGKGGESADYGMGKHRIEWDRRAERMERRAS